MNKFSLEGLHVNNLIEISITAGKAIMEIYKSDFNINLKSDKSPLTQADILSNDIIISSLNKITPNTPIISEESSNIPFEERCKWKEYWLIDPLDGTKEFIKKNGDFTTNIALIRNNKPIFGIIHAPDRDETYWGSVENGCYFLKGDSFEDSKEINVSANDSSMLRIVSSASHPSTYLSNVLDKINNYELITAGSSLKFCMIAKGDADCYPRLGLTSEWDTAAGDVIARSAGAYTFALDGMQLKYNQNKEGYLNPHFIVTNSLETKEMILSLI